MSLFLKKISAKSLVTQLTPLIFLTKTLRFKSSSPIVSIELKKKKKELKYFILSDGGKTTNFRIIVLVTKVCFMCQNDL